MRDAPVQPALVCNVFAERELAIHLKIVHGCVLGILPDKTSCPLVIVLPVFRGPPIPHVALAVETVALIVEGRA
jgi:hypothetical protein